MRILVTGGCGYVGSFLVPRLLLAGHHVVVVDTQWFGNFLPKHKNLKLINKMFNELIKEDLKNVESVIHLANIANDPSVELNPTFSWEVNVLHTTQLLNLCQKIHSIKQFIYASSGSVYGVKSELRVTEELDLLPISAYNKTKMTAERVLLSYAEDFAVHIIRPATICGLSPRMRFDVVVNMFVMQAFSKGVLTVLGGEQIRPNIHIEDMARVYEHFLSNKELPSGSYNAGFENISVMSIAESISRKFNVEIELKQSNDPRSYRQDSSKLVATGFIQTKSVSDAVEEVSQALKSGALEDNDRWYTVRWMTKNKIGELA